MQYALRKIFNVVWFNGKAIVFFLSSLQSDIVQHLFYRPLVPKTTLTPA